LKIGEVNALFIGERRGTDPTTTPRSRLIVIDEFIVPRGISSKRSAHVAQVRDRYADLSYFARGQWVIGVVPGLGRKIEGDGETGLALGEVGAVELVGCSSARVARVGPHHPGLGSFAHGSRGQPSY